MIHRQASSLPDQKEFRRCKMEHEKLAGGWTRAKLSTLTSTERHNIWKNCRTKGTSEAMALAAVIENLGLPYSDPAALKHTDPITIKMHEIINSPAGRSACIQATEQGLPAIAGVDGMLNAALGIDYRGGNMATHTAGGLVGELMRSLGYVHAGQKALPAGSVAKTGAMWKRRTR